MRIAFALAAALACSTLASAPPRSTGKLSPTSRLNYQLSVDSMKTWQMMISRVRKEGMALDTLTWNPVGDSPADVPVGRPVNSLPQALWATGGFTGGLSWDGRYLCGGGGHVAMIDLKTVGARPDTLSFKGIQSCNASISSSRIHTDAMMYLNTEGSNPAVNGGKPWGEWQTLLIGDKANRLLKAYSHPAAFTNAIETEPKSFSAAKWHHSEWSNHPYFAAATVNVNRFFKAGDGYENTMMQERIYLLNLKDSSYLEVLRPAAVKYTNVRNDISGFYWPWLWVEVPASFAETADWLTHRP